MEKIKLKCHCRIIGPLNFRKDITIDYTETLGYEVPLRSFFHEIDVLYHNLLNSLEGFRYYGFENIENN